MSKKQDVTVRSHGEEREWLLILGNGNILEGVRYLIESAKGGKRWEQTGQSRKNRGR